MFLHRKDLSCHSLLWAWRFQTCWSLLVLSQGQQWAVVWRFSLEHDRKVLIFHSLLQGYSSDKLCPLPDGNRIYKQKSSWLWKRYWSFLFKISQFRINLIQTSRNVIKFLQLSYFMWCILSQCPFALHLYALRGWTAILCDWRKSAISFLSQNIQVTNEKKQCTIGQHVLWPCKNIAATFIVLNYKFPVAFFFLAEAKTQNKFN